ncbi:hypothetical protein LWI29_023195 [Acer saccharum]|uniref:Thioredoxin domain-containing protein n=1 Tax=Acer saccharum TaxID=4024 RepID=A0AA39SV89_ACESA|nr:hypothetical protein LWI29_023195 [Acer saccharum]
MVRRRRSRYPARRRRQIGSTLDIGKSAKVSGDLILDIGDFEGMSKRESIWRIKCGHRKKLAPEWKRAANNLKGKVKLGHVDCDSDKSLMSRFNVQGFPTILVFGKESEELSARGLLLNPSCFCRTKRMSIEIGPSSFASIKKKSRKNTAS